LKCKKRAYRVRDEKKKRRGKLSAFFVGKDRLKLVFGTNAHTDSAYAPSADILEMLFHIFGAFFRIEIALAVCGGQFPKDCACRASVLAKGTISTAVFNHGQLIL
jgi:hypothetical protein